MKEKDITGRGRVAAVSSSRETGVKKDNQKSIRLIESQGVEGDAHLGLDDKRQVSLLALESIEKANLAQGAALKPGDYAENITAAGLELHRLPLGARLKIGPEAILEISQIGKNCHHGCAIKKEIGSCVMPTEGVFGRVLKGGSIKAGDIIEIV